MISPCPEEDLELHVVSLEPAWLPQTLLAGSDGNDMAVSILRKGILIPHFRPIVSGTLGLLLLPLSVPESEGNDMAVICLGKAMRPNKRFLLPSLAPPPAETVSCFALYRTSFAETGTPVGIAVGSGSGIIRTSAAP